MRWLKSKTRVPNTDVENWTNKNYGWRVLQNHLSIELDDSRLWQFNVHLVWVFKPKKRNTAFSKHLRFFMQLSEFSIERLADLLISMYHEFCWTLLRAIATTEKSSTLLSEVNMALRTGYWVADRISFWVAQDVNLSTTIDGCPFCTSWGWFFIPLRTGVFYIKRSVVQDLVRHQQNSSLQRLHLWWEISWNFHSIQPDSIRVWHILP